jgi:soluble lytic murein transglycosylase-like protein
MQINAINLKSQGITTSWADPAANIRAGANILRTSIDYFGQKGGATVEVPAWLAARLIVTPGNKPDPRPVADARERLWYGLAAYNAGPTRVLQAIGAGRSPDAVTTGNDYGRGVLEKAERIAQRTAAILSGQGNV